MKRLLTVLILLVGVGVLFPSIAKADRAFEYSCSKDSTCPVNGVCKTTCTLKVINNTSSLESIDVTLNVTGDANKVSLSSVNAGDGWLNLTGNSANAKFQALTPVTASEFVLATVEYEISDQNADCSVNATINGVTKTVTVNTETITQPDTGAELPIAILCGAAGIGIIAYLTAKKTKKLYKI